MNKVFVTGNTGAGKTTLSNKISKRLNINVYSLDSIVWNPGWVQATPEERRERTEELISQKSWIVDGVCSRTFKEAEFIVFLDLPLIVCLKNVLVRFIKNGLGAREGLPDNCPEFIGVLKSLRISLLYQKLSRPKIIDLIRQYSSSKKIVIVKNHRDLNKVWDALEQF